MSWSGRWAPYVPVAERKADAAKKMQKLKKAGQDIQPVEITGRMISTSFWGKAWCDHLESYSDFDNRLPRGRTYVRNGSVVDLQIAAGKVTAMVSGSSLYKVSITIRPAAPERWKNIVKACVGKIDSMIELLQGKFSKAVMERMTDQKKGLFPDIKEIKMNCSCPDWATMCKHVAAALYGVGSRLDHKPEHLFLLRQVDYMDLLNVTDGKELKGKSTKKMAIVDEALESIFGIDIVDVPKKTTAKNSTKKLVKRPAVQKKIKAEKIKKERQSKNTKTKKVTKKKAIPTKKVNTSQKTSGGKLSVRKDRDV